MRILFTGASSFTGHWFVRELSDAGHDVTAVFRRSSDGYEGVRRVRVAALDGHCTRIFESSFGDPSFIDLISDAGPWDLFCHHAADVTNYKSPDFDIARALANNTSNLSQVLGSLKQARCSCVLLTGSVFEGGEGAGSDGLPAVSSYGLSKELSARVFDYFAVSYEISLGKFVIPNPFGPYEEPRFTAYLIRSWLAGKTPIVNTPDYVRDNIHVSLLAKSYVQFAEQMRPGPEHCKLNPSGYVEMQGDFSRRLAAELAPRLNVPCPLELGRQDDFSEPLERTNTQQPDAAALGWSEQRAWSDLAAYYKCDAAR